jgi:molybdenum cofactor cytidylyltransferase
MGQPKALLRIGGAGPSLLSRVVATARQAGLDELLVVIGPPHGEAIREQTAESGLRWAWNPQPEQGMLSSVKVALPQLGAKVDGVLIWPVDLPFVQAATVQQLLAADRTALCGPLYRGRGGHPLWLPRRLFVDVLALPIAAGLRGLRERHRLIGIEVEDEAVLRDLDTPADVARARDYCGEG